MLNYAMVYGFWFLANLCNFRFMFIWERCIGAYSYGYLVEAVREYSRPKQSIIRNLGRKRTSRPQVISIEPRSVQPALRGVHGYHDALL